MDKSLVNWRQSVLKMLICLLLGLSMSVPVLGMPSEQEAAVQSLQAEYPGLFVDESGGIVTHLYGVVFGTGSSATAAAESFINEYSGALGVAPGDLTPVGPAPDGRHTQPVVYDPQLGDYRFTIVYYSQQKDGYPVFQSNLGLLVRNDIDNPLVLASSSTRNLGGFTVDPMFASVDEDIVAQAFADPEYPDLTVTDVPTKVIWAGSDNSLETPTEAVKFTAQSGDSPTDIFLYVVDASTGAMLYRECIVYQDITGSVKGNATEGPAAEQCGNEVLTPMPHARVQVVGGNSAFADANGNFTIAHSGSTPVTVESPVWGHWFRVYTYTGSADNLSQVVTPPGPANFVHNQANTSEYIRAQTNGYVEANAIRDHVLTYNPQFPGINFEMPVNVNRTDGYCPGNAWYSSGDQSLNFCSKSGNYGNTAFSAIIYHEYGHHLVRVAGSGQGQYGEGFGDAMGILLLDDPRNGLGYYYDQCNTALRNAENHYNYPCSQEIHICGQLLSGCIWDTRNALVATNPGTYRSIVSDLTINSVLLHTGTQITPQITVDFLTLDDNDGNLNSGTPHCDEIYDGFAPHNMWTLVYTPQVTSTTPANGAQHVNKNTSVDVFFNTQLYASSINAGTFLVTGSSSGSRTGTITYDKTAMKATFDPTGSFTPGETVTVSLTTGVKSWTRTALTSQYQFTFQIHNPVTRYVPSQYSTIQAAINASSTGDIVMVSPGTYTGTGNVNVSYLGKDITVQSTGGPDVTIIDCGGPGSDNRGFIFETRETADAKLIGFTVRNGDVRTRQVNYVYDQHGGAIRIKSASPTIQNCILRDNQGFLGGAIHVMKVNGQPDDVYPVITGCVFDGNSANDGSPNTDNNGGAILFINSHPTVTNCSFVDNHSDSYGGGVYMHTCTGTFDGCTFAGNGSIHGGGFCLVVTNITLTHTLIANTTSGCGIKTFNGSAITFDCDDFWSNSGGSIWGDVDSTDVDVNTIFADPLFCDWENSDYTLAANSPCLADFSPCDQQIGYYGIGCDPILPEAILWVEGTWGNDVTGDGSREMPYKTIGKAVSVAVNNDSIFVGAGLYTENIDFAGKKIVIHGYLGPDVTTLQPATPNAYTIKMTTGEPAGTQFSGFTVTNGGDTYTVMISGGGQPLIKDNVFDYNIQNVPGNNKTVIRTDNSNPTVTGNLFIHNGGISCVGIYYGTGTITNNVFDDNNRGFLTITGQGIAKNNIVTNSDEYGIYGVWTVLDYNDVYNNHPDYLGGGTVGPHSISANPLYIEPAADRYWVEQNSPCVGTGENGLDMGCFQVRYVPGQYASISTAVTAADDGDYVMVYPGNYSDNVDIIEKGIRLISYAGPDDPGSTMIMPAINTHETIEIKGGEHRASQISGFTFYLAGDNHMIRIHDEAYVLVDHNEFSYNLWYDDNENAVVIYSGESRPYITRNLFSGNSGLACVGIYSGNGQVINNTFDSNNRGFFTISGQGIARNNIVTYSYYYGVSGAWDDLDYNDVWENYPNYNTGTQPGAHDISGDPLYDADYALGTGSPCIDAGHPDIFYKDPDQSRNDMGAFATSRTWTLVHVPYDAPTIQDGINLVQSGGEVHVDPGVYNENINFFGKTIKVIGAGNTRDGDTTFLEPAVANIPTVTITSGEGNGTELSGFTIRDGGDTYTVTIGGNASPLIANNVFYDNILCGGLDLPEEEDISRKIITPDPEGTSTELGDGGGGSVGCGYNKVIIKCQAPSGTPVIKRNLFYHNGGISCVGIWTSAYAEIINNTFDNNPRGFLTISTLGGKALNNIVTNSDEYGIYGGTWVVQDYSDVWNNNPNYSGGTAGPHSISANPLYYNAAVGLYYLTSGSPCINAGNPDPQYNDPDGSRNDMGAFPYDPSIPLPKAAGSPLPTAFALAQNYPNPFNPTTTIRFDLPQATNVKLVIYNILGQQVITLVEGLRPAGYHEVVWNGRDADGHAVASGMYLYRLTTDAFVDSKKMVLLK